MDDRGRCLLGNHSVSSPGEIRDALRRFPRRGIWRWGSRRAVVVVTIITGAEDPGVLLTGCADVVRTQPGQLVLPGRRTDRGKSASASARRELAEELGMRLPPESVLGLLDDYQTRVGFVITPVVVWAGKHSESLSGAHVVVPFADLDVEPVFVAAPESNHSVIRLPLHGGWLHAPTAAVLYQFREVTLRRRRTRVAHLKEPLPLPPFPHSAG
ncbi:MAG: NUDIX domain-containing protein [Pseudonocardiaceae bacterium]